jgi:hypothetical protein
MSFGTRGFESLSRRSSIGEISAHFKTHGCEREATAVVGLGERGQQMDAAKTQDVAGAEEVKTDHYEAFDWLIDSISRDFSRKSISSRPKAFARKSRNAATICEYILAEQTGHNINASTAESKVKSMLWLSKYLNDKALEEMTKQDILSYLNSLRQPTSTDPSQKWIGSYNNRLRYYATFFRSLYNKEDPDPGRESAHHALMDSDSSPGRKNHRTSQAICGIVASMQSFFLKYCPSRRDRC